MLIEQFRRFKGTSEIYWLTNFAPLDELHGILERVPEKNTGQYLNQEFRRLSRLYGTVYDIPFWLKPVNGVFEKMSQRRAGVMISSDLQTARVLMIDTNTRYSPMRFGDSSLTDPEYAELLVWPMRMHKKHPSNKAWHVDLNHVPDPYRSKFLIRLTRIGSRSFLDTLVSQPGYYSDYWGHDNMADPVSLLKSWAGVK